VLEKSTTSGNGPYTLAGAGIDVSFNAFNSAMSVGDTTLAMVVEPGVAFWSGLVTYSATNQITLTTVSESKGTFGAGTKEIFMGLPASRAVYQDQINTGKIGIGAAATSAPLQVSAAATPDVYSSFTGAAAIGNKGKLAFTHLRNSDSSEEMLGYVQGVAVNNQSTGGVRLVARNGADVEVLKALHDGVSIPVPLTMGAKLLTVASASGSAGLNIPVGAAPSSPANGDLWNDGINLRARIASATKLLADQGMLRGFITGLNLSTAGASVTVTIAPGAAADTAAGGLMVLPSSLAKNTAAWSLGNNGGGLDTGTIANSTWYDVNLIERLDTGVVDAVFTLAGNAPTLPANYTLSRRLGSVKTDGSGNWTRFYQFGDEFVWDAPPLDINISSATPGGLYAVSVPPGVNVYAHLNMLVRSTNVGATVLVYSPATSTQTVTGGNISSDTQVANADMFSQIHCQTDTARQVRVASNGAGTMAFSLVTVGWNDRRGK
jgi:hypothetical protein